jgi:hypothetical protein
MIYLLQIIIKYYCSRNPIFTFDISSTDIQYEIQDTNKMPCCGGGGNPRDLRYRKWCSITRSIAGVAKTLRTNISSTDRSRWYTSPYVNLINAQCLALHLRQHQFLFRPYQVTTSPWSCISHRSCITWGEDWIRDYKSHIIMNSFINSIIICCRSTSIIETIYPIQNCFYYSL